VGQAVSSAKAGHARLPEAQPNALRVDGPDGHRHGRGHRHRRSHRPPSGARRCGPCGRRGELRWRGGWGQIRRRVAVPGHIDITLSDSVNAAVAEVLSRTGRIDILVNNAGIAGRTAPVWEVTDEDWQQIIPGNMTGAFYCCRAVLPHMRARRYGRIVNIASIAGK